MDANSTPNVVIKEVKINTLRHPAIDAMVPPMAGPRIFPIPTNIRKGYNYSAQWIPYRGGLMIGYKLN